MALGRQRCRAHLPSFPTHFPTSFLLHIFITLVSFSSYLFIPFHPGFFCCLLPLCFIRCVAFPMASGPAPLPPCPRYKYILARLFLWADGAGSGIGGAGRRWWNPQWKTGARSPPWAFPPVRFSAISRRLDASRRGHDINDQARRWIHGGERAYANEWASFAYRGPIRH